MAKCLNQEKIHMMRKAQIAVFNLRTITNLMKAPAIINAMILFRNQASSSPSTSSSQIIVPTEKARARTDMRILFSKTKESKS